MMRVAEKEGNRTKERLKSVFVCSRFVGFRRKRASRADAAYQRQLERGIERIDSEAQAQEVHFEALDRAPGEAGEAEKRELESPSAPRPPPHLHPPIAL